MAKKKIVHRKKESKDLLKTHPNLIWLLPLLLFAFVLTLYLSNSTY